MEESICILSIKKKPGLVRIGWQFFTFNDLQLLTVVTKIRVREVAWNMKRFLTAIGGFSPNSTSDSIGKNSCSIEAEI